MISSKRYKFDLHIIKVPEGGEVAEHRDPAELYQKHHRWNFCFWGSRRGKVMAEPLQDHRPMEELSNPHRFRPDIQSHLLTRVKRGSMWLLSFGWITTESSVRIPPFVTVGEGGTAMRLTKNGKQYYRDNGVWWLRFEIRGGRIFGHPDDSRLDTLRDKELVPCSEAHWRDQNGAFADIADVFEFEVD